MWRHAVLVGGDALVDVGRPERALHRAQHAGARAERIGKGDRFEIEPGGLESRAETRAALSEFARRRSLEREDRLLLVADRKHGASDAVARAVARGKFGNDVLDNVPLPRAGVLRLVDQDVVDTAVEL